jgi:hypothetical protein
VAEARVQLGNPDEKESLLLEAVTRGLVRHSRQRKLIVVVNCSVCEITIVLEIIVVTICKKSLNAIINPNLIHWHSYT